MALTSCVGANGLVSGRDPGHRVSLASATHKSAPACSRTIRVPDRSTLNQPCAIAKFRPDVFGNTATGLHERGEDRAGIGILADVDIVRHYDFQKLARRGPRVCERSIGDVSHAG
jgi:hypothetical protein